MNDFRLKSFQAAAKNLSFTKAAQELFITQPAVTKHIHELEAEYKVRLFERLGHRVILTDAGRLLLKHSQDILAAYQKLDYEMHLLHNESRGELRLGASTTIAQYVVPALLARFTDKFPYVTVSLLSGNSREVEEALHNHRIDLGLVEGLFRQPTLRYTPFLPDELVAVVHRHSHLARLEEVSLEELPSIPLVLRERGSGTLDVLEAALKKKGLNLSQLQVRMYLGSTESIKRFLEQTECMGIVSVRAINREIAAGEYQIIDIPSLEMTRELMFVQPQGEDSGIRETFIRFASHYNESL